MKLNEAVNRVVRNPVQLMDAHGSVRKLRQLKKRCLEDFLVNERIKQLQGDYEGEDNSTGVFRARGAS